MNIKKIRKNRQITLKALAEKVGVSYSVISRYENGLVNPPADRLQKIAEVLDTSVDALIKNDDDNPVIVEPQRISPIDTIDIDIDRYEIVQYKQINRLLVYSKGICELCGNPAPFHDKNGNPYLEIHHIKWLSEGGKPTPKNTVVLCPNCHKRIHLLNDENDLKILQEKASKHE